MEEKLDFGEQRRVLEKKFTSPSINYDLPICVRLDGKNFSTYTAKLKKPFDERLSQIMIEVMNYLIETTHAKIGYTQSDEISLLFYKMGSNEQPYLGGRIQKTNSILASIATAKFNELIKERIPEKAGVLAFFDCRMWEVPDLHEALNVFVWRQEDGIKNAITMAAHAKFGHKSILGKNSLDKIAMLNDSGIDFNSLPDFFKLGTFGIRKTIKENFPEEFKKFKGNENKEFVFRSKIENYSLPRLRKQENAYDLLFAPMFEQKENVDLENNTKLKMKK